MTPSLGNTLIEPGVAGNGGTGSGAAGTGDPGMAIDLLQFP